MQYQNNSGHSISYKITCSTAMTQIGLRTPESSLSARNRVGFLLCEDSDQTARMRRLISDFAERTYNLVENCCAPAQIEILRFKCWSKTTLSRACIVDYEGHAMRKRVFGHVRTAKAQISLRISAVWSGPSLSANWIIGYYTMYKWRA